MKTVVRILFSAFFVSILVGGFAYAAPGFNLMSLGGMDFFKFFKDDASNVGIEASAFHTRINDSYLPSPVDNYNYIRGKTFLGNDTVVVDASGNLGIGTITPGAKFDVISPADDSDVLNIRRNGSQYISFTQGPSGGRMVGYSAVNNAKILVFDSTTDSLNTNPSSGYVGFAFKNLGVDVMRLTASGNLGIGTTFPGAKLEVAGQIKITGGTPGAGKVLTSDASGLATWTTPASGVSGGQTNYVTRWLSSTTLGTGSIYDNGTSVGIGTASPGAPLEVNGHISVANADPYVRTNTTNKWLVLAGGNGWFGGSNIVLRGSTAAVNPYGMEFFASGAEIMRIAANGNVGVGTATPGTKLDVVGNVRTSSKFISTLATGTAPLEVTSTTVNTNLNADMVDGLHAPTGGVNPGANALVRTDGNGYTFTNYINSSTVNNENPTISQVIVTNGSDNYYRKAGISALTSAVQSNASGTWPIAISGNAATASALTNMNVSQFANNAGYLTQGFVSTSGQPASTALANESGNGAFMVQSQGTAGTAGAAFMSFHRPSSYAAYFGIDTDNKWKVGGWSMGATSYPLVLGGGYTNDVITGTTPTAAAHLATKAYVDAAVGAAGGGGVTYLGVTSATYTGNWGGLNGGNAKCQAQYGAGARVMNTADMSRMSLTSSYANGWINCDMITYAGSDANGYAYLACPSAPQAYYGVDYYYQHLFNCGVQSGAGQPWTQNPVNYVFGPALSGSGVLTATNCSGAIPIHCVK